jgi:uncharacterized membrane protein YhaH (DUF805 family)
MFWYFKCLKQYADFSGRARRTEFGMFTLFSAIFACAAIFIDGILGTVIANSVPAYMSIFINDESAAIISSGPIYTLYSSGYKPVYMLFLLAVLIPYLAVSVRRLHDTGKNGWWSALILTPLIIIVLLSVVPGLTPELTLQRIIYAIIIISLYVSLIISLGFLLAESDNDNQYGKKPAGTSNVASFKGCYLTCLERYVKFKGKVKIHEYWLFFSINLLFLYGAICADIFVSLFIQKVFFLVTSVYLLGVFLPYLAISVRRLHDTGKSGWWVLISLIPLIGFIWLCILLAEDSDSGEHKYVENPERSW